MKRLRSRELRLLLFLIVTSAFVGVGAPPLGIASPGFLGAQNQLDTLLNATPVIIAAAGMTVVIVAGGIDISIGSLFGACAIIAGLAAKLSLVGALVAPLALGVLVGAINGVLIALARIPSLVATLGMLTIVRGLTIYFTGGNEVRELPPAFRNLSLGELAGVPYPILLAALAVALTAVVLARTRAGRCVYAVGGNEPAARLSGISVTTVRVLAHASCGLAVGLAAFVHAARFSSIQPTAGAGFELVVITAVVLGGASILGGTGNVLGSALGAFTLQVIPTALTFLRVPEFWKDAATGAVVLLAVLSSASARRSSS